MGFNGTALGYGAILENGTNEVVRIISLVGQDIISLETMPKAFHGAGSQSVHLLARIQMLAPL